MDEVNRVEEFFNSLKELSLKRKQRIAVLNLIEVWNFLSEEKKQEFAERILDLAECYERSQIMDNEAKECEEKGHDFNEWSKDSFNGKDSWFRKCKRCGHVERVYSSPKPDKPKIKRLFGIKKPF